MDFLNNIWVGITEEFSDLPSTISITKLIVRLCLSGLLGGLLGWEREIAGKAAGLRTLMLICMGTSFFIATQEQAGMSDDGLSRVIQGLVAGIGFLGAGAILKQEDKGRIEGLTTAASIWFIAAIGISVGMGREASAVLVTLLGLVILRLLPRGKKNREADLNNL